MPALFWISDANDNENRFCWLCHWKWWGIFFNCKKYFILCPWEFLACWKLSPRWIERAERWAFQMWLSSICFVERPIENEPIISLKISNFGKILEIFGVGKNSTLEHEFWGYWNAWIRERIWAKIQWIVKNREIGEYDLVEKFGMWLWKMWNIWRA